MANEKWRPCQCSIRIVARFILLGHVACITHSLCLGLLANAYGTMLGVALAIDFFAGQAVFLVLLYLYH
jgi:hypothetical protein